ncbi:MAG: type II secretion system F family protein, partial [Flavobacteriales bacterium]|nr:type II secretion system F family protein [Flavobacteriales bacterium]
MKFKYKSLKIGGENHEGIREAVDKFALFHDLKKDGETLLYFEEINDKKNISININILNRVKNQEKIIFAKNLSSMLEAGLPLSRALSVMERQTQNPKLKETLISMNDSIRKG